MTPEQCLDELRALRNKYGTYNFDAAVKKMGRERLQNRDRPDRVRFPWSAYKRQYARQNGVCPVCDHEMVLLRGRIHMDHIDPNAENFNALSNLQVLHIGCNLKKGSDDLAAQTKHQGRTVRDILNPTNDMDYSKEGI